MSAHKGSAYWAAYSQSGDQIVTGGVDKMVYVWDRKNSSKPLYKCIGNEGMVRSVGFMNDDQHIFSTSMEGEITIFDAKSGEMFLQEKCISDQTETEGNIIYSGSAARKLGDGKYLLTTHEDCATRSWELNPDTKELKNTEIFIGHSNTVRHVDFSPSEQRFVTGCEDHSLRVWDIESSKGLYLLAGHTDFAVAADFIDEKTLLSCSWDCTVKFWKLPS